MLFQKQSLIKKIDLGVNENNLRDFRFTFFKYKVGIVLSYHSVFIIWSESTLLFMLLRLSNQQNYYTQEISHYVN